MRRTLTLCRTGLAGVALVALLTACGGSSGNSASSSSASDTTSSSSASTGAASDSEFCTKAAALIQMIQAAPNTEDPSQLGTVFEQAANGIRAIDPPQAIASDWVALADGLEQLGTAYTNTNFNDPQQAAAFQQTATELEGQLSTSSTKVETYLQTQCGIDTSGTATATS